MAAYKSFLIKLLAQACIIVLAVAAMPHHHHGSSTDPCIGILHCVEDVECAAGDGCCDADADHALPHTGGCCGDKHTPVDDECSFSHQDAVQPERDESRDALSLDKAWSDNFHAADVRSAADLLAGSRCTSLSYLTIKRCEGWPPPPIFYLAGAVQPRAPSIAV